MIIFVVPETQTATTTPTVAGLRKYPELHNNFPNAISSINAVALKQEQGIDASVDIIGIFDGVLGGNRSIGLHSSVKDGVLKELKSMMEHVDTTIATLKANREELTGKLNEVRERFGLPPQEEKMEETKIEE